MNEKKRNVFALLADKFRFTNDTIAAAIHISSTEVSRKRNGKKITSAPEYLYKHLFDALPDEQGMSEQLIIDTCISYLEEHDLYSEYITEYRNGDYKDFILAMMNFSFGDKVYKRKISLKDHTLENYSPNINTEFYGRDDMIDLMDKKLHEYNHIALCGIGGIGKSTIARKYAMCHKDQYHKIQYLQFEGDIRTTIEHSIKFTDIDEDNTPTELLFERKLSKLNQLDKSSLIIIDNMDADMSQDNDFAKLINTSCHLVITTRNKKLLSHSQMIEVLPLNLESQIALFKFHVGKSNYTIQDENEIKMILTAIKGHTLGIELIAKTIENADLTYAEMLEILKIKDEFCVEEEICIVKDSISFTDTMGDIVSSLFDFSQFNKEEIQVMANLALVPINSMSRREFKKSCGFQNANSINHLITNSWISKSTDDVSKIWLHPLIAEVVREKGYIQYETCTRFIGMIKENLLRDHMSYDEIKSTCLLAYNTLTMMTLETLDDIENTMYFIERMSKHQSFKYAIDGLKKIELLLQKEKGTFEDNLLERVLGELAKNYLKIADYDNTITYNLKLLEIEMKIDSESLKVAKLYNALAFVYRKSASYDKSLEYFKSALEIRKKKTGDQSLLVATTYNDMALIYLNRRELKEARRLNEKALKIRESNDQVKTLDLAYSYNNIGTVCRNEGDYDGAIEMHKKALLIREKELNKWHLVIASSLSNIGVDYELAGMYEEAEQYYMRTKEIREKICNDNHPDLAWMHTSFGSLYLKQGKYNLSIQHLKKAHGIRIASVGRNHPYVAVTLKTLAEAYVSVERYKDALNCLKQAQRVQVACFDDCHESVIEIVKRYDAIDALMNK